MERNYKGEVWVKIALFIIGTLVGAVISTSAFLISVNVLGLDQNNNNQSSRIESGGAPGMSNNGNNQNGQSPQMPSGDSNQNGQPPEMPNNGSNQNGQPPAMPNENNSENNNKS